MIADDFNTKAPQPEYHTKELSYAQIPLFLQLQKEVKATLEKPHHLKTKTDFDLTQHMHNGMKIIGIFDQNHALVAAAMLTDPLKCADKVAEFPVHANDPPTIIMQTVMVHPKHGKKNLAETLDHAAQALFPDACLLAKIAEDNHASKKSFMDKRGFQIVGGILSHDSASGRDYQAIFVRKTCCPAAQPAMALTSQIA